MRNRNLAGWLEEFSPARLRALYAQCEELYTVTL
jgi:hypothetical protein